MGGAEYGHTAAAAREALQLIAEGLTELAGFEVAAISVVQDGRLHTIAVAGSERATEELAVLHPPIELVLAELANAQDFGMLKFVAEEDHTAGLSEFSFVPDLTPVDSPDAWRPRDLLVALLEDDDGELRGLLSVDVPRNGLRPDAAQREVIERYARRAGRALVTLLQRQEFEDGMRRERATSDYRGHLIDALAHQLQNPVAAISGNLELLFDDLVPGDAMERPLRAIERATGRIQTMITDLLALAKVNNPDHGPLHETDVDLAALVHDCLESATTDVAAAELTFSLELPAEPATVRGDPGELEDLVSNLVSNAIKYSEPGGGVVVGVRQVSEDGTPYVELTVADEGLGIADEERAHLFEEFFRSERPEVRSRPGTGLGLVVVDRVVRRHRGRIEVESEVDEGTTIRVLLPAL